MSECGTRCGKCCTFIRFGGRTVDTDEERWLGLHGFLIERVGDEASVIVPHPCSDLDFTTMSCRDYENRPQVCRDFTCSDGATPDETPLGI
jgi:Fe-S-cluster containining protein